MAAESLFCFTIGDIFLVVSGVATSIFLACFANFLVIRRSLRKKLQQQFQEMPCKRFSDANSCAVCLEQFAVGEIVQTLPECGHMLHKRCAARWFSLPWEAGSLCCRCFRCGEVALGCPKEDTPSRRNIVRLCEVFFLLVFSTALFSIPKARRVVA